jgi:Tfp pilus assembly protein PilF
VVAGAVPQQAQAPPAAEVPVPASDGPDVRAALEAGLLALAHGEPDKALAAVAGRDAEDPAADLVTALVDRRRGRDDQALGRLAPAAASDPLGEAALELGLLLRRTGKRAEGDALLEPLASIDDEGQGAPALLRAARAARALGQSRLANGFFRAAAALAPGSPRIETEWGTLFLERHNEVEAAKAFQHAIDADERYLPAIVGLARTLSQSNAPAATELANRALEIDASSVDAHLVLAGLALDDRRGAEARTHIDKALSLRPRSTEALSLRAALAAIDGRQSDFESAVGAVLQIDPRDASAYRVPSEHVAGHYRFDEAVALGRKAVAIDPDDAAARAALGMHLMRTGDEEAAREQLDAAFSGDPFDTITFNLLGLLDTLRAFETVREDDLVFRFHPDEAAVMKELVPGVTREAIAAMAARYGFTPEGPILIEMFPRHDDFAVRTAGLPGMIGALGACFGRVVTLDSPRAMTPGAFNWAATLWHELAHVFTLQMSRQRVPRWLTEGISVYEERLAREQWGREAEFEFVRAMAKGETIPLASLNQAFSDPRRITLAYQQSSLVVEFLVRRSGEAAVHRTLRAFGDGLDEAEAMRRGVNAELAHLQGEFDAFVEQRYGAMASALKLPEGVVTLDVATPEEGVKLADSHPGSFVLQMVAGQALAVEGRVDEAARHFGRAHALVPIATGSDGPRALLAAALLEAGQKARAAVELDKAVAADDTGLDQARALAELAGELDDAARGVRAHTRISDLQPLEAASQTALGRAALAAGDASTAARRFRLALAAGPENPVSARTDHAEALLAVGQQDSAKRELLAALENAPLYARAQDLLLKVIGDTPRERRP